MKKDNEVNPKQEFEKYGRELAQKGASSEEGTMLEDVTPSPPSDMGEKPKEEDEKKEGVEDEDGKEVQDELKRLQELAQKYEAEERQSRLEEKLEKVATAVEAAAKQLAAQPQKGENAAPQINIREILDEIGGIKIHDPLDDDEDHQSTLRELAETYPQVVEASAIIAQSYISKALKPITERLEAAFKKTQEVLDRVEAARAYDLLWKELAKPEHGGHTDAETIVSSKAFADWLEKQSPGIRKLADEGDVSVKGMILTKYKLETGYGRREKKQSDTVHRESLGKTPPLGGGAEIIAAEDIKQAFEEEAKREAARRWGRKFIS